MTTRRTTFGKLQRERDRQAKAAAKKDRRSEPRPDAAPPEALDERDEQRILDALATLHQRFEDRLISQDEFETRRASLLEQLHVA